MLGLAALLLAVQVSPWYYSQRDAAVYLSIARHLAHGDGLRNMDSPVLWFPPGYPMLLSPLFCLRDLPLLEISVVHWFLAVGLLWGIYRWARSLAPQGAVWIAALSVGTNAVWIHYRQPVSEMAFMAAMAWLLVSFEALTRPRGLGGFLAWLAAAVGLTIVMCLIRSVGIALAAGGSCALLASAGRGRLIPPRRVAEVVSWRLALVAAMLASTAAAMTVGGVILRERWAAQPLGAATYLTSLETRRGTDILEFYGPWFALVVSDIGRITVPFMFKSYGYVGWWWDVNMLIYVPWFGLLLYGYFRWLRRGEEPLAWSLPFYLAVLTYFRWESGARWWVPMTPALFMCLWFALEPWGRHRWRILRAVWLLHVLAALVYWIGVDLPRARSLNQKWPTVDRLADQITVDRDQVVIDESLADLGTLLDLQLDRRVKEHSGDAPIPTSAQWLILPTEEKPPPGFVPQSSCGGCELLHRVGHLRK
ncbi:MAG: hypothetical protein ACLP9L_11415 [Thermoguttaceae bacterium]